RCHAASPPSALKRAFVPPALLRLQSGRGGDAFSPLASLFRRIGGFLRLASLVSLRRVGQSWVMSDEVRASHILLMYAGSQRSSASRSKAEAEAQIQDLASQVSGGADFAELARQHSD